MGIGLRWQRVIFVCPSVAVSVISQHCFPTKTAAESAQNKVYLVRLTYVNLAKIPSDLWSP